MKTIPKYVLLVNTQKTLKGSSITKYSQTHHFFTFLIQILRGREPVISTRNSYELHSYDAQLMFLPSKRFVGNYCWTSAGTGDSKGRIWEPAPRSSGSSF